MTLVGILLCRDNMLAQLRLRAKLNLAMPKNHDNSLEREIRSTCNTHVILCIAPHDSWLEKVSLDL